MLRSRVFQRSINLYNHSSELRILGYTRSLAFTSKQEQKDESASYETMKDFARKTGSAEKEWMEGSSSKGSSVYKAAKRDAEEALAATKRGASDATSDAKHAASSTVNTAGVATSFVHAMDVVGEKISEATEKTVETLKNAVGGEKFSFTRACGKLLEQEDEGIKSARAVWEETRTDEQKAEENADNKSRLLDEATRGDNAEENRTRDEKRILPNDFYTRH